MDQMIRRTGAADGHAARAQQASCSLRSGVAEVFARPARRRGKELERAIFDATLDQLTSGGYARLTMEGVAGAARTGKAALYRRWTSKVELVLDALDSTLPPFTDIPDLGSARSEFVQLIDRFIEALNSRAGGAMHALMSELEQERAGVFREFVIERVVDPAKCATLGILRRGEARGDVRPGVAGSMVVDVAPAMLMYQWKMCGGTLGPGFTAELVDEVLLPLVRS